MPDLPEIVSQAWASREGPVVLTTVSADGVPNSIYANCAEKFSEGIIAVTDNYFNKTRENLQRPHTGSLLFITAERKAYQIKGRLDYETEGELFDFMLTWSNPKHPRVGVAIINVEEVYCGGERLL